MNRLVDNKTAYLKKLFIYIFSFFAYKLSYKIVVTSGSIKSFLIKNYKLNPKKIVMIHNFVDIEKFRQLENVKRENRILFVGRLEDEKNPILLLEALLRLKLPATFVGSGTLKHQIIKRIQINDIKPDIKLINFVSNDNLPKFYSSHTILVIPSKYEGQPKVLLEAMACKCAVIGTDVLGIRSIIKNNNNGLLAENNLNSLANNIKSLWNDSEKRQSLGINAREYVLNSHSIKKVVEKEIQVINEFLKKK